MARDFNRKLERLIKLNPKTASSLPQFYNYSTDKLESMISVDNLKRLISTRSDYNRILNMLKRFMVEGAEELVDAPYNEYGTRTTKWHAKEMGRLKGIVNTKRKQRLDRLEDVEMMSSGGKLGYTLGERFGMGLASRNQLSPTNAFTPSQTQRDINYKLASLMKQATTKYFDEKDNQLKANFIRELERNFAKKDISDVTKAIREMPDEEFVLKFEAHGDGMEMAYPPAEGSAEYTAYVEDVKSYWLRTDITNILNQ